MSRFALGSIALQNILLTVVSHTVFNTALSLLAFGAVLSLLSGHSRSLSSLFKAFLVVAFVRFSLGLVIIANGWVDMVFLHDADEQRHSIMMSLQSELRDIDALASQDHAGKEIVTVAQSDMANLQTIRNTLQQQINLLSQEILEQDALVDRLVESEGLPCTRVGILIACPDQIDDADTVFEEMKLNHHSLGNKLVATEEQIAKLQEDITCLQKRQRGKDCSVWDKIPSTPNPAALQKKLGDINANLSEFADNCINLLMSLILKTIIIPLLFIYALLKIIRLNWGRI